MRKRAMLVASCVVLLLSTLFVLQLGSPAAIPVATQAMMVGGAGAGCANSPNCVLYDKLDCINYADCDYGCPAGSVRCFDSTRSYVCDGDFYVMQCWPWATACQFGYVMTGECVNGACAVQGSAGTCPSRYYTDCIDM